MDGKNKIDVKRIQDYPELVDAASKWFSSKWSIPAEAYRESMQTCIRKKACVPQWYLMLDDENNIFAGAGVIENDFHDRKDLTPNICVLFVEPDYRRQNRASYLLDFIRKDFGEKGFSRLYLVTDHTAFYEKCGWKFLMMVTGEDGQIVRMYTASVNV